LVTRALQGTFNTEDRELVQLYDKDSSDEESVTASRTHSRQPSNDVDDIKSKLAMLDGDEDGISPISPGKIRPAGKSILHLPDEPSDILRSKVNLNPVNDSPGLAPMLDLTITRKPTGSTIGTIRKKKE
jgi:hypothetical protein